MFFFVKVKNNLHLKDIKNHIYNQQARKILKSGWFYRIDSRLSKSKNDSIYYWYIAFHKLDEIQYSLIWWSKFKSSNFNIYLLTL